MKVSFPNSLFARLFLLLFVILSVSYFAGREVLVSLGFDRPPLPQPHHPFRLMAFMIRLTAVGLTSWIAARWLAYPIRRLANAAEELGKNLNSPLIDETSGPSEVRQASKVFNQMQARLKQQMEERNRFLAAVSHDLRTPLTRLKLRAEKITEPGLKTDVQSDIDEMASIIDTTLDYLRGDAQPEAACLFDLDALVHTLAEDANGNGSRITVTGKIQPVRLQPVAIRRCLNNLLENALRYGGSATISMSETTDQAVIAIRDAGPGIPPEKLEAVFAPFYRLDSSRSRHSGGVGLGLSIARDMARKHGGNVTLANAPGGGLVATLNLPRHY
jgi:signal transduction histidine kinase